MSNIKAVICAGGMGTRLWPISRKNTPKQLKPFLDDDTLIQKTYNRLSGFLKPENIFLSTPADLADEMMNQVPISQGNLIIEPMRRDTGPALGLAALKLSLIDPQAIMTNVWADHFIGNEELYRKIFYNAESLLADHPERIFLVGVKPTYPETGYGYIKMGKSLTHLNDQEVFHVDSFKEKPDLATAQNYISQWEYLWNPAMFFFRAGHILNLFQKHAPEIYAGLMLIKDSIGKPDEDRVTAEAFASMPKISIDYAILEKESEMYVMPADLQWTDVGHWKSIYDILVASESLSDETDDDHRAKGHAVKGAKYVEIDSNHNLIFSETGQLISTIGLDHSLVIASKDAILICKKDRAQEVKKIVEKLGANPATAHLL